MTTAPSVRTTRLRPPTGGEVHRAYLEELNRDEQAVLMSWLWFTHTFGGLRLITYCIRKNIGPFRNISMGGAHLHHYLWGIGILAGVGAIAVHGEDRQRKHPVIAGSYGTALALIVDELALLIDLKEVYWATQGRISVDLGVGLIAAVGTGLAALPLVRRLARDRQRQVRR